MPKVISVKYIGKQQTYDLEVEHPDHQYFLANGLLTSNSHATSYGVVTFWTAYFATYHPLEWFSSVLTFANAEKKQECVDEIKRQGYTVLPVDINLSKSDAIIENESIRLPFSAVKGVGPTVIKKIESNQPYDKFFWDFIDRSGATKTSIVPLIKMGAFPQENSRFLLTAFEQYSLKVKTKKWRDSFENEVLSTLDSTVTDFDLIEKMQFEHELMGFSLAGSAFDVLDRRKKIESLMGICSTSYQEFLKSDENEIVLPIVVKEIRERSQKNKEMMAFLKLGTLEGDEFEVPCFAGLWKNAVNMLQVNKVYLISFFRKDNDRFSLVIGQPGKYMYNMDGASKILIDLDKVSL